MRAIPLPGLTEAASVSKILEPASGFKPLACALRVQATLSPTVTCRHGMCDFRGFLRVPKGRFHPPSPPVTCGGVPCEYHKKASILLRNLDWQGA